MKICKRIAAAVVITVMLAACIPGFAAVEPAYPDVPEGYDGYVTFAVSALTMGWTYLIDPVLVPIHEGETFDVVTIRAFEMLNWSYSAETTEYGFNLTGIGCYETEPMVPDYLMNEILAYPAWADAQFGYNFGGWTGNYVDDEILTAYEYCDLSGWMYSVDNIDPGVGADACVVEAGSVYTWFFTIYGWGMDYGVSNGWGSFPEFDNPMEGVDRTAASETMALISADEELVGIAVDYAFNELFDFFDAFYSPEASQELIDSTLEALLEAMDVEPSAQMGDVNGDGEVTAEDALLILRYSLELIEFNDDAVLLADVNGDGEVDLADALITLRMAMGIA